MQRSNSGRGVIFDLDGTLLNTLEDLAGAMNSVLSRRGWATHPVSAYRRFVGNGVGMLVRRAMPSEAREEETISQCVRAMREEYGTRWAEKTQPYAGVTAVLAELALRGIPMAVFSNKPDDATQAMVRHFFPNTDFRIVTGAKPEKPRKPDPAVALEIAEVLQLSPEHILFLGDSDADMLTARSAGMTPLGAGWGFRGSEELVANGAEHVLKNPEEILTWVRT